MIEGIGDSIGRDSRVDYYEHKHDMSHAEAERNAFEDRMWDDMDK